MNRTKIRGVTAGVIGATLSIGAAVTAPAIASGAEGQPAPSGPVPVAQQRAALHWHLPRVPGLRHLEQHRHGRVRHPHQEASRSSYRRSLTGTPQTVAHALVLRRGWSESQWSCLDALWTRESGWRTYAVNHRSGAYGIPQALPATKMASAGADWRSNPITQIRWGLSYIAATYGSPCAALTHSSSHGYY